jgi:Phospholipase_D-nuclease N-terminal
MIVWLVVLVATVSAVRSDPQRPDLIIAIILALAAAFDLFCLVDIARADEVRYLPKWAWALICLAQAPGGGIVYLCVGRVGRPRPAPPSSPQRP